MKLTAVNVALACGLVAIAAPRIGEPDRTSESRAIAAIRAIVSGELAYASGHDGYYGTIDCLADPSCTGSTGNENRLLSPDLISTLEQDGYRLEFHANPTAGSADRRPGSALTHFAVVVVPVHNRPAAGRGLCADDRGVIYVTDAGVPPRALRGRCLDTARTL